MLRSRSFFKLGLQDIRKILDGFLGISPYAWPGGEIEFEISKIRKKATGAVRLRDQSVERVQFGCLDTSDPGLTSTHDS